MGEKRAAAILHGVRRRGVGAYYENEHVTIYHGRALEVMRQLPAESVDMVLVDPPYYRYADEEWDKQWATPAEYLAWVGELCDEWRRVLGANGSVYVFASPEMAGRVEGEVARRFVVLNSLVWVKLDCARNDAGMHSRADAETLRRFFPRSERLVFAEQYGADGLPENGTGYATACEELRTSVFEPLRAYLDGERRRAGVSYEDVCGMIGCAPGSGMPSHYFSRSQWSLPTGQNYEAMRQGFAELNGAGEYLGREYEYLRREYEELRRPFAVTKTAGQYTDVWEVGVVPPGGRDRHPCEKPVELLRVAIEASTRPGAVILDCCAGSGSVIEAAVPLGRRVVAIEMQERWCGVARGKALQRVLPGLEV